MSATVLLVSNLIITANGYCKTALTLENHKGSDNYQCAIAGYIIVTVGSSAMNQQVISLASNSLVHHSMTNDDSSVVTARGKEGIARVVAHLPDCLLVVPAQRSDNIRQLT